MSSHDTKKLKIEAEEENPNERKKTVWRKKNSSWRRKNSLWKRTNFLWKKKFFFHFFQKKMLRLLCEKGDLETIKARFIQIDDLNSEHEAMALASKSGNAELVEYLYDYGFSVLEHFGEKKMTCLHFAAEKGHEKVVDFLIGTGLCVDVVDGKGQTPLDLATENEHCDVIDLLLSNGATYSEDYCERLENDEEEFFSKFVEELKEKGFEPCVCTIDITSTMTEAVLDGDVEMVKRLAKKFDLNEIRLDNLPSLYEIRNALEILKIFIMNGFEYQHSENAYENEELLSKK